MVRYVGRRPDDEALRGRLEELAAERRRFGFRRLTVLLRREGVTDNVKRILRAYREANLQVRRRVQAVLLWGAETRCRLSRECLAIEVDTSISGHRVARVLEVIAEDRGLNNYLYYIERDICTDEPSPTRTRASEVAARLAQVAQTWFNGAPST